MIAVFQRWSGIIVDDFGKARAGVHYQFKIFISNIQSHITVFFNADPFPIFIHSLQSFGAEKIQTVKSLSFGNLPVVILQTVFLIEKFENFIAAIEDLKVKVGIKKCIKDYDVDEKYFLDTLDDMVEKAFDDQCTGANPRYPLMAEIKEMYLKAYYGK